VKSKSELPPKGGVANETRYGQGAKTLQKPEQGRGEVFVEHRFGSEGFRGGLDGAKRRRRYARTEGNKEYCFTGGERPSRTQRTMVPLRKQSYHFDFDMEE